MLRQAGQGHRRAALSGNNGNFLHTTKVSVSSPLTSYPVAKGKAPHSEQEQDQVAAVTAAQHHATRSSHWASKDGIHQGKEEVKASLLCRDRNTKALNESSKAAECKVITKISSASKYQQREI